VKFEVKVNSAAPLFGASLPPGVAEANGQSVEVNQLTPNASRW
jgi:hypothetical protein